jgi:phosphonate transport system permease protein
MRFETTPSSFIEHAWRRNSGPWPILFFESNTRSSTIIGIVGAGGNGQHFSEQIMVLEWQHVAFLIFLVLVTVAVIDYVSRRLRAAIIGKATT